MTATRQAGAFSLAYLVMAVICAFVLPSFSHAQAKDLIKWDALVPVGTVSAPVPYSGDLVDLSEPVDWPPVASDLLDRDTVIDGYVLPLTRDGEKVVEFLLVPWIGACIHTPAPPPNQIIHITYPAGLSLKKPYEPVRVAGRLKHQAAQHPLFLVDGSRLVAASYVLDQADVSGTPGRITAASALEVPLLSRVQIRVNSLFTDSLTAVGESGSAKALIIALLLSFAYGALHTLGPGHGKTVVISYFVGTGGSLRRGLTMGMRIAIIHVMSAIVLVFALDFVLRQTTGTAPSDYRAIRLVSYGLIIAIGAVMFWQAVASILTGRRSKTHDRDHRHTHGHHHNHDHHHHDHSHQGCAACEAAVTAAETPRGGGWIAASIGIVPCTGALIVMLFGLANDLILPAVLMVLCISAGMAVAMSVIGIAALWGRGWAERSFSKGSTGQKRFISAARVTGSACVLAIGIALFSVTWAHHSAIAIPDLSAALDASHEVSTDG